MPVRVNPFGSRSNRSVSPAEASGASQGSPRSEHQMEDGQESSRPRDTPAASPSPLQRPTAGSGGAPVDPSQAFLSLPKAEREQLLRAASAFKSSEPQYIAGALAAAPDGPERDRRIRLARSLLGNNANDLMVSDTLVHLNNLPAEGRMLLSNIEKEKPGFFAQQFSNFAELKSLFRSLGSIPPHVLRTLGSSFDILRKEGDPRYPFVVRAAAENMHDFCTRTVFTWKKTSDICSKYQPEQGRDIDAFVTWMSECWASLADQPPPLKALEDVSQVKDRQNLTNLIKFLVDQKCPMNAWPRLSRMADELTPIQFEAVTRIWGQQWAESSETTRDLTEPGWGPLQFVQVRRGPERLFHVEPSYDMGPAAQASDGDPFATRAWSRLPSEQIPDLAKVFASLKQKFSADECTTLVGHLPSVPADERLSRLTTIANMPSVTHIAILKEVLNSDAQKCRNLGERLPELAEVAPEGRWLMPPESQEYGDKSHAEILETVGMLSDADFRFASDILRRQTSLLPSPECSIIWKFFTRWADAQGPLPDDATLRLITRLGADVIPAWRQLPADRALSLLQLAERVKRGHPSVPGAAIFQACAEAFEAGLSSASGG